MIETCPARAALAGNPSDGYGGAVLAVPVHRRAASISIRPFDRFELRAPDIGADGARSHRVQPLVAAAWDDIAAAADRADAESPHALLLASIASVAERVGPLQPMVIEMSTTVPRSVGLAGSSAIVIAAIRCLLRGAGCDPLPPDELAALALSAEVDRLGIAAGPQDRFVQAHGVPLMMRFDRQSSRTVGGYDVGSATPVDIPPSLRIVVGYRPDAGAPSQHVHGRLRRRFDSGDAAVVRAMHELREHAESAAAALVTGDVERLGAAVDGSLDVRRSMIDLDPRHLEMVEACRRAGAWVNYAGSGGSVVAVCPDEPAERRVAGALDSIGATLVPIHDLG